MYSLVTEQQGPTHVGLHSSKNKYVILNHMVIGRICWLKL